MAGTGEEAALLEAVPTRADGVPLGPEELALGARLLAAGRDLVEAGAIYKALAETLADGGLPVVRGLLAFREVHPELAGRGLTWRRGEALSESLFPFEEEMRPDYLESPVRVIHEEQPALRRRLDGNAAQIDFPVLRELQRDGHTDYFAQRLTFSDGTPHFLSWCTDRPGGFRDADIDLLQAYLPLIALRLEIAYARYATSTLLQTYLGHAAADRVSRGATKRTQAEEIDAIIAFADLRGFTATVERLPPRDTIRALNLFFETVADPVEARGGDVVKLVGDGILAIFPVSDTNPYGRDMVACRAVSAIREAMQRLDAVAAEALPEGLDRLTAGYALHSGRVVFGNIGSSRRLDFTVIGPAVNEVVRIEALTKTLQAPILFTDAFSSLACGVKLKSLGFHVLPGVPEPKEILTLDEGEEG